MKKFITIIVFSIVTLTFFNCSITYTAVNSDRWKKFELRPSQVLLSGNTFFTSRLDDNTPFFVFWDKVVQDDGEFYYNVLMDDFGWTSGTNDKWTGDSSTVRRTKFGYIYVNPKRKVAIYFDPSIDKYRAFKVRIGAKKQ
jgi:hypothetical protein